MATRDDTQIPRQALQQRLAVQKVKSAMQAPDSPLILTFSLFGRGLAERWTFTTTSHSLGRHPATECSSQRRTRHLVSKMPGINSGDVLLSHNLSSHYHRGCSVSLPCSEWERVGPLR